MGIGTPQGHLPLPQPARQWGQRLNGMELPPSTIHIPSKAARRSPKAKK